MIYGEAFEEPASWANVVGGGQGTNALDNGNPFGGSKLPSMHLTCSSGSYGIATRGLVNEGLFFQANKPYEGYIFAK